MIDNSAYGDSSDGDRTISTNTTEGSVIVKSYNNLTIDASVTWTLKHGSIIRVAGTLTIGNSAIITSDYFSTGFGTGGVSTDAGAGSGGNGGKAGGTLLVYAKNISCGTSVTIRALGETGSPGVAAGTAVANFAVVNGVSAGTANTFLSAGIASTGGIRGSGSAGAAPAATVPQYYLIPLVGSFPYTNQYGGQGGGGASGSSRTTSGTLDAGNGASGGAYLGAGGAGGAGVTSASTTGTSGGGGGGGGSGGTVFLGYRAITNPANLTVSAAGGAGGVGGNATTAGTTRNGGAGGGGAGGGFVWVYGPSSSSITISAAGGGVGTGGTGTTNNGGNGSAGSAGIAVATSW
jgi:hypothetical protein